MHGEGAGGPGLAQRAREMQYDPSLALHPRVLAHLDGVGVFGTAGGLMLMAADARQRSGFRRRWSRTGCAICIHRLARAFCIASRNTSIGGSSWMYGVGSGDRVRSVCVGDSTSRQEPGPSSRSPVPEAFACAAGKRMSISTPLKPGAQLPPADFVTGLNVIAGAVWTIA